MSLTDAEKVLVSEALKLIEDGLAQLSESSTNSKVQVVARIVGNALHVAEMLLGV